jgi:hypothetical protein
MGAVLLEVPPHAFHLSVIFILHNNNVVGWFEIRDNKYLQNKIRKNTGPYKTTNAVDPAKRGQKRARNGPAMLDFRPGAGQTLPAHRAD